MAFSTRAVEAARGVFRMRSYKYSIIPEHRSGRYRTIDRDEQAKRCRRLLKMLTVAMALCLIALVLFLGRVNNFSGTSPCDSVYQGYQCSTDVSHHWGQYSPFFSVPSEINAEIPSSCTVTFAQVLSRHGARYPTPSKSVAYRALVEGIKAKVTSYGAGFEFIDDFSYTLGEDQLTPFGEQQLLASGIKFYERYQSLASSSSIIPFVRATGQERVIRSARNFTRGFQLARTSDPAAPSENSGNTGFLYDMVVIPEGAGSNNTLHHGLCTNFETGPISEMGGDAKSRWAAIFVPPIQKRVNENLTGANLTEEETIYLMDMCPFTTIASTNRNGSGGKPTQFCHLFTPDEWVSYDYYESLSKWYGYGRGNPLGPTQGVGWVNELIARLTDAPVVDDTSSNRTLDSNPDTFPLGRRLYADFGHDNDMTAALAAMQLFSETKDLDQEGKEGFLGKFGSYSYSASVTTPFAGRMYLEKMMCKGGEEEMVRVLLNDRVMPLAGCRSDELGRCKLGEFVESLAFATGGGMWDRCFT